MYSKPIKCESPTIGIDFDDTITTNPVMWTQIVNIFTKAKCKVYIVTYREANWNNMDITRFVSTCDIEDVIYTNCKAKSPYCSNLGIDIDIWIDDMPFAIVASLTAHGWEINHKDQL